MEAPELVFGWRVSTAGYRWESDRLFDNRDEAVTDSNGATVQVIRPFEYRAVHPLDTQALARRFADLDPDNDDALLAFANEWGPLTTGMADLDLPTHELRETWRLAINGLRRLYALSDAIGRLMVKPGDPRHGDRVSGGEAKSLIKNHITWASQGKAVTFKDADITRTIRPGDSAAFARLWKEWTNAGAITDSKQSDLAAAQAFRMMFANELLEPHPITAILPLPLGRMEPPPSRFITKTLEGALYLQAYLEITGQVHARRCAGCGEWFDATELRRDARFDPAHGSRCSARASRAGNVVRPRKGGGEDK